MSVVTLLFGATTVLNALQAALDQIWQSGKLVPVGVWGWFRARLLSLGFILALGFLLLVSLTISTGLSQLRMEVAELHTAIVGAAASFAALLLWLYYTAQIFLFGAEFTACLGGLRSGGRPASRPPASAQLDIRLQPTK